MNMRTRYCPSCNGKLTDKDYCPSCGVSWRDVGWGSGALRYNANAAIAALTVVLALLAAKPVSAQPEPLPNALTAIFFHDGNKNGALDSNEPMAADVDLTFHEKHADGTESSYTARSDSNGYFSTAMQPCPCQWSLRANGETFSGDVEPWTGNVYVNVAIKKYNVFLPTAMSGLDVTGDVR